MPDISPAFVFVHGAWHGAATWHKLIPLLEARRIGKWPTVIRALLYVNKFVRRMVVNVGGDQFPVVD